MARNVFLKGREIVSIFNRHYFLEIEEFYLRDDLIYGNVFCRFYNVVRVNRGSFLDRCAKN